MTVAPYETRFAEIAQRTIAACFEIFRRLDIFRCIERKRFDSAAIRLKPLSDIAISRSVVLRRVTWMLHLHNRCVILVLGQRHIAARCDASCVTQRVVIIRKEREHFSWALHIQTFGILQTSRIVLVFLHRNAAERVVRVVIFFAKKVRVVVNDEWKTKLCGKRAQMWIDLLLLGDMALQLDVETRFALGGRLECCCVPTRFLYGAIPMHAIATRLHIRNKMRGNR